MTQLSVIQGLTPSWAAGRPAMTAAAAWLFKITPIIDALCNAHMRHELYTYFCVVSMKNDAVFVGICSYIRTDLLSGRFTFIAVHCTQTSPHRLTLSLSAQMPGAFSVCSECMMGSVSHLFFCSLQVLHNFFLSDFCLDSDNSLVF